MTSLLLRVLHILPLLKSSNSFSSRLLLQTRVQNSLYSYHYQQQQQQQQQYKSFSLHESSNNHQDVTEQEEKALLITNTTKTTTDQNDNNDDEFDSILITKVQEHFKSNLLYTITIPDHKPSLGCTAEESLYIGETNGEIFVFISKIVAGGAAANAGLEVGDLIVGVSGTFEDMVDVFGQGLDRVRSLIAGRPEESELVIKIVRNTDILQKHESALVDLCIIPEGQLYGRDKTIETCIETMYKTNYDVDDSDETEGALCSDEDVECMLDAMNDLWNDEADSSLDKKKDDDENNDEASQKTKPAPWSSRSSPSGTYVRVNGTMVNIDE